MDARAETPPRHTDDDEPVGTHHPASPGPAADPLRRFRRALRWSSAASAVVFVSLLWNFGFDPLRPALASRGFSDFFDFQARALSRGRLDIEPGKLGIEAFVIDGREYLYFPPGPAIPRIPLAALTERFDGRLTAVSMLVAFGVLLVAMRRLLWTVRTQLRGDRELSTRELVLWALLHLAACGGSVVVYLAAMPWVYHEVYVWSIALTLGALEAMMRFQADPNVRRALIVGAWVLPAILVRTTAGWALAFGAIGLAIWCGWRAAPAERWRTTSVMAGAGVVPLVVGSSVNWAKFQHPFMFPLESQVFTGINAQRRLALEANGGDLVSLELFPTLFVSYFRPDAIRFNGLFPYLAFPSEPPTPYFGAVVDQSYRTGSVSAFMPVLFVGGIVGLVLLVTAIVRGRVGPPHVALLVALLAGGPVLVYGYISYRYTAEFVPALVVGSAIAACALADRLEAASLQVRRAVVGVVAFGVAFGVIGNFTVGYTTQRTRNPGDDLRQYVNMQRRLGPLTGHPLDDLIVASDRLGRTGTTDEVRIVNDCELAVLGTGDPDVPWELISVREWDIAIDVGDRAPEASDTIPLGSIGPRLMDGAAQFEVLLRLRPGEFRVEVHDDNDVRLAAWYAIPDDGIVDVEALVSLENRIYSFEPALENRKLTVPMFHYDGEVNTVSIFTPVDHGGGPGGTAVVTSTPRGDDVLCSLLRDRGAAG